MCRFVLYMGPPVTLDLLTTRPVYSIIRQSFQARMRVEPLNGDGFGLAWYVPDISPEPALFRSIQPAWNNMNLRNLARVTRSETILAHVRAATAGFGVSEANCHPFTAGPLAFMHNGSVAEFARWKRSFQENLSDEAFAQLRGDTDSEHVFAMFGDILRRTNGQADRTVAMADALEQTMDQVVAASRQHGAVKSSFLNIAVTDGQSAVISRCVAGASQAPTLYLRTGRAYVCEDGVCHMVETDHDRQAVIVASEPLTDEEGWQEVPRNHLVLVHPDHHIEYREVDLPQYTASAPAQTECG